MVNDSEFADDLFKVMESYEGRRFIHRLMEPSHMDAFSLDNSARDYNLGQSVLGLKLRGILARRRISIFIYGCFRKRH